MCACCTYFHGRCCVSDCLLKIDLLELFMRCSNAIPCLIHMMMVSSSCIEHTKTHKQMLMKNRSLRTRQPTKEHTVSYVMMIGKAFPLKHEFEHPPQYMIRCVVLAFRHNVSKRYAPLLLSCVFRCRNKLSS